MVSYEELGKATVSSDRLFQNHQITLLYFKYTFIWWRRTNKNIHTLYCYSSGTSLTYIWLKLTDKNNWKKLTIVKSRTTCVNILRFMQEIQIHERSRQVTYPTNNPEYNLWSFNKADRVKRRSSHTCTVSLWLWWKRHFPWSCVLWVTSSKYV